MEPTDDLRTRLRAWLRERIPAGGTDADTRFTNAEIDDLLSASDSLEQAAWMGWMEKAAMIHEEGGGVVERSVGSERLKLVDPSKKAAFALQMADYYYGLIPEPVGAGSKLMELEPPDVLGTKRDGYSDISRLIGY